jgi:Common central domain of tyrosinase/Polyphenol oxidase middle domain
MKSLLLSLMTALIVLVASFSYAKFTTISLPKSDLSVYAPAPMCATGNPNILSLPEFVEMPAYKLSLAAPQHVRRDISKLTANDPVVIAFKKGITVMKKRAATDPTSWTYQANIHGTRDSILLAGWNSCTHKTDFFLSWHRMYLYFFERILRKASGDPAFALPYWDWSKPNGRSIPQLFREPRNPTLNPLYQPRRDAAVNLGGFLAQISAEKDVRRAMKMEDMLDSQTTDSISFKSTMEGIHGKIHVAVGGNDGMMRFLATAAQDPIFWMHHCNVDQLWEKYMVDNNPAMPNPKDPFLTKKFAFFDENGKQVTMSGKDVMDAARQLNYKYEEVDVRPENRAPKSPRTRSIGTPPMIVAVAKEVSLSADKNVFTLSPTQTGLTDFKDSRFLLIFDQIRLKGNANGAFELYLNQDPAKTPDPNEDNYIGSIDFFGLTEGNISPNSKNHIALKTQRFDATEAVITYLTKNNRLSDLNVVIYHRVPEAEGVTKQPSAPIQAAVGLVKLVKY